MRGQEVADILVQNYPRLVKLKKAHNARKEEEWKD